MSPSPPPPGRKTQEERRTESARRLVEAAIELFAEQGYEATSTAAIAERAGYSRSLVNVRYGSKEALLEALLKTELEDRLLAPATGGATGLQNALAPIDRMLALLEEDARLLRAFFAVLFEAVGPVPVLRPHVAGWLARLQQATAAALAAGLADGSVHAAADTDSVVSELAVMPVGMVYRWLLEDSYDLPSELRTWRSRLHTRLTPETY